MARFRVVGPHAVDGVKPGDVLTVAEDTTLNLGALLSGGHLELLDEHDPDSSLEAEDVEDASDEGDDT